MRNNINIIWEVEEHKLGSFERQKKETDPTVMEDMICYYLFTSHENQIVAVLNFSSIQSRYIIYIETLPLWTLFFLV